MVSTPTKSSVAEDVEVVRRILAHIDAGTTDEGDAWREPVENYLDPGRFTRELEMLRSFPSVYVPSAAIPKAGDHVERVSFGVPLFAVRDHDGRARVFRNACRHRGMALVEGPGCAHALVCRYHGWTYRLDGSLSHVPHADAFPDLDVATRGLVEVDSREVDGLIVIGPLQTRNRFAPRADAAMAALTDGSPWRDKLLPAERLVYVDSTPRADELEGSRRAVPRGLPHPLDAQGHLLSRFSTTTSTSSKRSALTARITFPYKNIERLRDRPESAWTIDHRVTFVYHLFPNVMLATFPDQVLVVTIDPVDIDHSTVTVYAMATAAVAEHVSMNPDDTAGARGLLAAGALEDNEMSEGVQRGLHAGANTFLEFGTHESAIGRFHATLDERLEWSR